MLDEDENTIQFAAEPRDGEVDEISIRSAATGRVARRTCRRILALVDALRVLQRVPEGEGAGARVGAPSEFDAVVRRPIAHVLRVDEAAKRRNRAAPAPREARRRQEDLLVGEHTRRRAYTIRLA